MLEVEVKFCVPSLADVRATMLAAGAHEKKARVFERNIRYDDAEGSLLAARSLLRLRLDTQAKITWKGVPANAALLQSEAKIREEIEIVVSDFDSADLIIKRLGFAPQQSYEKYRETLQLGTVEMVLDQMPYGDFIELEGPEPDIKALAAQLNLDWSKRITTNYLSLLTLFNEQFGVSINDLTFDKFQPHASFVTAFAAQFH